jgi:outer membrane biosynthesis protein TonB
MRGEDSCRGMIPAAILLDMAEAVEKVDSVRLTRFDTKRLVWALVVSLMLHFLAWGGYEWGKKTGLWQRLHWPTRQPLAQKKPPTLVVQEAEPSIFLDVDPDQASPDTPKDAKYYSSKNSRAANPDADKDSNQPKLTGKQTDVPKTKDIPKTQNAKPTPPAPQPQPKKEAQPEQPKPKELTGDTKLAKLETSPDKTEDKPERPRTVREALAQRSSLMPSMQMQQEGGTRRQALVPSLDARATPFGAYDSRFIAAVTQRWYDLLDSQKFASDRSGKVTLQFHLNADGSINDVQVLDNTVGDLLSYVCQKAVTDPSPFAPWPSDMRRMVGANFREIVFTFYYY